MENQQIVLTKGQNEAVQDILRWSELSIYSSDENNVYNLSGAAGTGKTTVVTAIINALKGFKIMVSAPTHKAKEVISEITKKPGVTIHSLLGLKPNIELENFDPNNPTYQQLGEQYISKADIHIIDECSMINKELTKLLIKQAVANKVRIILIGDKKQLPPVKEKLSITFMVKHKYELTEIIRQKGDNPNQTILALARDDVDNTTNKLANFFLEERTDINRDINGVEQGYIITKNQEPFYNKLIELYSDSEYKDNMNFIKTLVYTNEAVKRVNTFIKKRINPSKEILATGDFMLGYKTVMDGVTDKILVQNSKDYKIHSLEIIDKKVQLKNYKFFRICINFITKEYIDILHPDSYKDFAEVLERLFDNAENRKGWRPFYKYKESFIIMENFYHSWKTDYKGNPKSLVTKDIDLGYAMTVHKSQGSTYNNVAIIYNNIKTCWDDNDRKRLAYVAVSRCKSLNLIYG